MAAPKFSEYTYKVSYRINKDSQEEIILSEGLRIIEAKTNIINDNGESVEAPNPNYDYFMDTLITKVTPIKDAILIITRNEISDGSSIVVPNKVIYNGTIEFLSYDRRLGILINDTKVGDSNIKRILFQLLNVNDTERIPCRYVISGIDFTDIPNTEQHIDISYKKTSDNDFIPLETNLVVPINGTLDGIELGELPDDTEYTIKVYHREAEIEKLFTFYTNIVPTIGTNPILGRIEWNGRVVRLDARNVKMLMYPDIQAVDWMFPMDYSTKAFAGLISSLWTSDGYETNNEDYHFVKRTSFDNDDETYIGCHINKDHYIGLPINYYNPQLTNEENAYQNIKYSSLFITQNDTYRNTIFIKFYIDEEHEGYAKLIQFCGEFLDSFIGLDFRPNNVVDFVAFNNSITLGASYGGTVLKNKWYTMMLVCRDNHIVYGSITDDDNYSSGEVKVGTGIIGNDINSKAKLIPIDRTDFDIDLQYSLANIKGNDGSIRIRLDYAIYKYAENTEENSKIKEGHSDWVSIAEINDNNFRHIKLTVPNDSGYGCAVGYTLQFFYGGTTLSGQLDITVIHCGNYVSYIDSYVQTATAGMHTDNGRSITITPVGDINAKPIGGIFLSNLPLTYIDPNIQCTIGKPYRGDMNAASYVVAKFGLHTGKFSGTDNWNSPYQYIDTEVVENLATSYKKMPKLVCINSTEDVILKADSITELKDSSVSFRLHSLPVGDTELVVKSDTTILSRTNRTIKSIKLTPAQANYDIDFESNFDNAIIELKKRYYAKQKRWGGNMGGGTHGSLIYFNRKDKCLILEQHGDLYQGRVPSVAPAGSEGYGLPVDIIECPSTFPYPTIQRSTRVGGLIQSVDYHPYGMFDCWFQIPKGMTGLAICLWYFHYQEIYSYDDTFKFWTEQGVNGYNYANCVKTGYGAKWVVINNEIDMELGSENTPYRTNVNPNIDQSIYWYVPGLSKRQMIGCTEEGANYGTWIIDWESSLSVINSVTETNPQSSNSYLRSDRLKWVKVMDTIDEVNYGANNRSCRFNNWMAEQWNDGCGVYGTPANSRLGLDELSINNRTPLGNINLQAIIKYVEHYYDDGEYHKWSIDWTKDYTRLLIDDEEISVLKAFVPFNPMTMLIGCWFPSANVYDKSAILGEWGTWSGVHANWDVALMKVKRIKFNAYTEEQVPTTNMRYDCETYAEDGLKEIL